MRNTHTAAFSETENVPTSAFTYQPSPTQQSDSQVSRHETYDKKEPVSHKADSSEATIQNGLDHHVSTSMLHLKNEPSKLPQSQSPYITLLQKNRGVYYADDYIYLKFNTIRENLFLSST